MRRRLTRRPRESSVSLCRCAPLAEAHVNGGARRAVRKVYRELIRKGIPPAEAIRLLAGKLAISSEMTAKAVGETKQRKPRAKPRTRKSAS